jgi:transposase
MAERRSRRRFTAEFEAEAVKRLLEGGKGLSEVATELGRSPGHLSRGGARSTAATSPAAVTTDGAGKAAARPR